MRLNGTRLRILRGISPRYSRLGPPGGAGDDFPKSIFKEKRPPMTINARPSLQP